MRSHRTARTGFAPPERQQYVNTLQDLITFALGGAGADATAVFSGLSSYLGQLPPDQRPAAGADTYSFHRLDQAVQQNHVAATYEIAAQLGAALTTPSLLAKVVGTCATDSSTANDDQCLTDFIQRFGERALRHPITADDLTFYRGVYASTGIDPAGFADVIGALVASPDFFYRVESGAAAVGGLANVYSLNAYELASRLSYQFWDTAPDDALWAAAKSGNLLTPEGYATQLTRLFTDPRAKQTLQDFFHDWLKTEDIPPLDQFDTDPEFQAFAGTNLPTPSLRDDAIAEVDDLTKFLVFDKPGSFADLMTTNSAFPRTKELAAIYGLPVWDGASAPPAFTPGARPGLLTRAALLAYGNPRTRPILRGVFVRKTILCDTIPPPPANAATAKPEPPAPGLSTRQAYQTLTGSGACNGCHGVLINPIGFAFEGFDSLGRARTAELIYSATGEMLGTAPIDTATAPQIVVGDTAPSTGPSDLMAQIIKSGKANACFAAQIVRFTYQRPEDAVADACDLANLTTTTKSGTLSDVFLQTAKLANFKQRTIK